MNLLKKIIKKKKLTFFSLVKKKMSSLDFNDLDDDTNTNTRSNEKIGEYEFVLLQKSNIFHPPIIPKPMIRIVGFARTREEAEAIKNRILQHKGAKYIPLFIEPVQCLQMIGITPRRHLDLDCVRRKKDFVFDAHDSWNRKRFDLHEKRMQSDKKSLDFGISIEHRNEVLKMQKELQEAFEPPEDMEKLLFELNHFSGNEDADVIDKHILPKSSATALKNLSFKGDFEKMFSMDETAMTQEEWNEMNYCLQIWPNELILSDQHFLAVTIIPDFSVAASNWIEAMACGNEPFYILHTACQTSEEMEEVNKTKIWNKYSDADTYIHPMYKWMDFTTIFDENIKTSYMDPLQDKIMTGNQKERQIVAKFEKLKTIKKTNVTQVKDKNPTVLDLLGAEEGEFRKNHGVRFTDTSSSSSSTSASSSSSSSSSSQAAPAAVKFTPEEIENDTKIAKQLQKIIDDQSNRTIDQIINDLEEIEKKKD